MSAAGPFPQPWHSVFGSHPDLSLGDAYHRELPGLKVIFASAIAQAVVDRATLMQEIADALPSFV